MKLNGKCRFIVVSQDTGEKSKMIKAGRSRNQRDSASHL